MNSILKVLWILSFVSAGLLLILSYGYLPDDIILFDASFSVMSKATFFNYNLITLAILFFIARIFHKGIREMNWAFVFPLSRNWRKDAENRDAYRIHIDSWLTSVFMVFNVLFMITIFLIWSGNDGLVFSYQNVFIAALLIFSTILILTLIIPPFIIYRGPVNTENGS